MLMDRRRQKRMTRHWAKAKAKAMDAIDRLDFSTWFDLWHTHPDWHSKGNRFLEDRVAVARITVEVLRYAEQKAFQQPQVIQVFATICQDTGNNAIYLHTENPNGTPFPQPFPNVTWGSELPKEFLGVVEARSHEVGLSSSTDLDSVAEHVDYIVRARISEKQ